MRFVSPLPDNEEKRQFLNTLWDLHTDISEEVLRPNLDASRMLRLIALGVNHCLVGMASLITTEEDDSKEDPQQMMLFEDVTLPDVGGTSYRER